MAESESGQDGCAPQHAATQPAGGPRGPRSPGRSGDQGTSCSGTTSRRIGSADGGRRTTATSAAAVALGSTLAEAGTSGAGARQHTPTEQHTPWRASADAGTALLAAGSAARPIFRHGAARGAEAVAANTPRSRRTVVIRIRVKVRRRRARLGTGPAQPFNAPGRLRRMRGDGSTTAQT